jgi:hypothetical protein
LPKFTKCGRICVLHAGATSAGSEVGWPEQFRFLDMVAAPFGSADKKES